MREYRLKVTAPNTGTTSRWGRTVGARRARSGPAAARARHRLGGRGVRGAAVAGARRQRAAHRRAGGVAAAAEPARLSAGVVDSTTTRTASRCMPLDDQRHRRQRHRAPYASEVPASLPYKYLPPADAVSGMPAAAARPRSTRSRRSSAWRRRRPLRPPCGRRGRRRGRCCRRRPVRALPARPPPPPLPHAHPSLITTEAAAVAPPPAPPPAARPTSHPPRSSPPHRRPRGAAGMRSSVARPSTHSLRGRRRRRRRARTPRASACRPAAGVVGRGDQRERLAASRLARYAQQDVRTGRRWPRSRRSKSPATPRSRTKRRSTRRSTWRSCRPTSRRCPCR